MSAQSRYLTNGRCTSQRGWKRCVLANKHEGQHRMPVWPPLGVYQRKDWWWFGR